MCLSSWTFKMPAETKAGYGKKLVRRTEDPCVFLPEFEAMSIAGDGGMVKGIGSRCIPTTVKYIIGQTTIVRPFMFAYLDGYGEAGNSDKLYPAACHLWKTDFEGLRDYMDWLSNNWKYTDNEHARILCHYSGVLCEDEDTVVATQITPIMVIDPLPGQEVKW